MFADDGHQTEAKLEPQNNDDSDFSFMSHIIHRPSAGTAEQINETITALGDICGDFGAQSEPLMQLSGKDLLEQQKNLDGEATVITAADEDLTALTDSPNESEVMSKKARLETQEMSDNTRKTGKEVPINTTTIVKVGDKAAKQSASGADKAFVPLECPFSGCKQMYFNKDEFHQHLDGVHNLFVCSVCSNRFPTQELLDKHSLKSHPKPLPVIKIVPQPKTRQQTVRPAASAANKTIMINDVPISVTATRAGPRPKGNTLKTYSGQTIRVRTIGKVCPHIPVGTDTKDNECGLCPPKSSAQTPSRNSASKRCKTCGQVFPTQSQLEAHIEFFDTRRITLKDLICFQCHKIFQGQALINEHKTQFHLQLPEDDTEEDNDSDP